MARTPLPQTGESTPDRSQRPRLSRRASRRVDHARRAEIGAERRLRTRVALLDAALELFGQEHGRATRIEDVCARARVARGTFYNHFTGIEALLEALSDDLTRDFDDAVHGAFEAMKSPVERTCGAIRYYLHGAIQDPRWGWAMVNSSVRTILFGERVARRAQMTIQEGIDSGDFTIESAVVGRDILLGAGLSGTLSLLHGGTPANYPEKGGATTAAEPWCVRRRSRPRRPVSRFATCRASRRARAISVGHWDAARRANVVALSVVALGKEG
jgi:AcrR family transcriptional regulator